MVFWCFGKIAAERLDIVAIRKEIFSQFVVRTVLEAKICTHRRLVQTYTALNMVPYYRY